MEIPEVTTDRADLYQTNYFALASFCILIWDHIITFDQEVKYIWLAKKHLIMFLFLINRYLTPLGFIVNLSAYLLPLWTPETCRYLVRYEGAMTVIGLNIVALMMFTRIKALYQGQRIILGFVAIVGLASCIMNAYLLTMAATVVHNPESGVRACKMVFEGEIIKFVSTSARLPFAYDTVVLALTLFKTFPSLRNNTTSYVMRRLAQDGILYYCVILSLALIWSIMIVTAPKGIQNIAAPPYLLLTVTMMSRISLNLKSSVDEMRDASIVLPALPRMFTRHNHLDVVPGVKIVIKQTKAADSDFGVEMSTDLRRNWPNSGQADQLGSNEGVTTIRSPNRQRLSTIQQESSDWGYSFDSGRLPAISLRRSESVDYPVRLNTYEDNICTPSLSREPP